MAMNPRLLRPRAGGAFTPKSIAGLALWLDGSDSTTMTLNGSTVSEWRDKSGNLRHATQATAASQPTFAANHRNGLSALTWDGARHMTVASFPVTDHFYGIAVASFASGNRGVFARGAANDWNSLWYDGANAIARTQGNVDSTRPISTNTFYTLAFRGSNTIGGSSNTSLLRVNGVAGATATNSIFVGIPPANRGLTIGGLSASLFRMSGAICELLYYQSTSQASDSVLSMLERYAARKWGVSV